MNPTRKISRFPRSAPSLLAAGRSAMMGCVLAAVASVSLLATAPARAVIGAVDFVPAATLLLPYFEVDLANPDGPQTSFTVVNTAHNPTLAHVTLWTDYAVPSYVFDLYIGGRDTVEVDLGLLLTKGIIPKTAPSIGTAGPLSGAHGPVATCNGVLPPPDKITSGEIAHLQNAHTGKPSASWGNQCGGAALNDTIARGYVTIDQSNVCSFFNATTPGYFSAGGNGVAGNQNILIGESKQINRTTKLTITEPLVSIEASSTDPATTAFDWNPTGVPNHDVRVAYTFYGRFVAGAADQREPLGGQFSGRFINGGTFPTGTTVTLWRDFDRPAGQVGQPFACNSPPVQAPERTVVMFDEQEHLYFAGGQAGVQNSRPLPGFVPTVFPRAAQRVHTSTMNAPQFGFSMIDITTGNSGDAFFNGARQGYASFQYLSTGQFGASVPAKVMWSVADWAFVATSNNAAVFNAFFPNGF